MAGNLIQITDAGRAALVAAGNTGTVARRVTEIGLGTAAFTFDKGMKTLPNERKRVTTFGGENVAPDTVHVVIQDDTNDQYTLYAFGLYLDNSVLFGVYVQSTPILEKSPAAMLLLASDIVFASIDAAQLQFGPATFLNPPATTERKGVVELATQAEVDAGADDSRAITPKTAAARYAALTGAKFTGPVVAEFDAGPDAAHVTIRPPSGKTGREGRVRLYGTFGGNAVDTGTRLIATLRSGFDGGVWGREYLDIWLNKTGNDAQTDANQARAVRITYGGRVLIGDVKNDDGGSRLLVGGNTVTEGTSYSKAVSIDGGAGSFSTLFFADGGKIRWSLFKRDGAATGGNAGNNFGLNAFADDGVTQFPAFRVDRSTQVFSLAKRLVVGDIDDDGLNAVQVKGRVTSSAGVKSAGTDNGGAQFRASASNYGVILRNDDDRAWFLTTAKGNPDGSWNSLRPFSWALDTGKVSIDGTGAGVDFGGNANVAGNLWVGTRLNQGEIRLGPVDGFLYSNKDTYGWWTPTQGAFQYYIADRTFRIDGNPVWHSGNVTPLDRLKGGTMAADVWFDPGKRIFLSEGSAGSPSLTFQNDGAPDTGLYHIGDGSFGITCNSLPQVAFTPTGTNFERPVQGPTPPQGDRSTRLATTEWVLSAISTVTVGQIVFEPRTLARAGFLKANGVLVNRADYPALWAYAQASGSLVSEAEWMNGRWGCFSTGDGASTFRLPEMRGEFIRCWADGRDDIDPQRAIGSYQGDQNRSHAHGASASEVGDHAHSAWTDSQGWHGHHGWTTSSGDHQHIVPFGQNDRSFVPPWGTDGENNRFGASTEDWDNKWFLTSPAGNHNHQFDTEGAGNHGHNVGIGGAGRHSHGITVNADGGSEARPRNIALLAMIRAY
ncbi:phage tail protein [Burkholderia sp. EMB26]|uniref:phage tail fiber protein n=1 Tax=Burkholderia sp. EMB26 TaxID=2854261 RepID=UPI00215ABC99|nr:phage tail protein [Burkholderia sp. EMB26]UVE54281.1 phage tail protein [Burkholderia sp. EMB26]